MSIEGNKDCDVVLVVDDVPENLAVLCDALDEADYMVLVAYDGQSALERLTHLVPDIILLDAVMPGIDGFETCRRIKAHRAWRDVPVIFMTGLTESESVVRGFAAGGVDYVTKPIVPEEVMARVGTHLRNARLLRDALGGPTAGGQAISALADAVPARMRPQTHYDLTSRERQVLDWLACGKTNRDIAQILEMSPRTVSKHLEHIFIKLGVETRSAAASLWARRGSELSN